MKTAAVRQLVSMGLLMMELVGYEINGFRLRVGKRKE